MTVNPGNKGTPVVPPKDLKFVSSTRLMYTRQPNWFGTKILQIPGLINNTGHYPGIISAKLKIGLKLSPDQRQESPLKCTLSDLHPCQYPEWSVGSKSI